MQHLVYRLGHSAIVILGVSFIVFMLSHLTGDPAALMLPPTASASELEAFRRDMGYDRPLLAQYAEFFGRAVRGDLGQSLWTKQPAIDLVLERLPATFELAGAAMVLSILIAFPLGVVAAVRRGSVMDRALVGIAALGQSMPPFWLGLILILIFGVRLHLFPVAGRGSPLHLVLPAVTLSAYFTARNSRVLRSTVLEALGQDYVRTARAKGLPEIVVLWRHAVRNALIPVVTLLGLQFGALLGGAIVTETVFAWPGLGRLIVQAIVHRDFPLLQAAVLFVSVVFLLMNILVDLVYTMIDPRIKL